MGNNELPSVKMWPFIILVIIIIGIWSVNGLLLFNDPQRGTFGDMFGSVNALFAGLAFAGIIYAIYLQRKDLELQRRELRLTREELDGQKRQLQAQNETLRRQNFENTFFQLIELHNDIVKSLQTKEDYDPYIISTGRKCFEKYYIKLKGLYNISKEESSSSSELEFVRNAYKEFFEIYQFDVGHYFRNLYNLLKYVKNSEISDKRVFTNIVRAQLSVYEIVLLFYDCISEYGYDKFKPIVEEFSLLNNMPEEFAFDPKHLEFIDAVAYKASETGR